MFWSAATPRRALLAREVGPMRFTALGMRDYTFRNIMK
jgi:hypothetical protein